MKSPDHLPPLPRVLVIPEHDAVNCAIFPLAFAQLDLFRKQTLNLGTEGDDRTAEVSFPVAPISGGAPVHDADVDREAEVPDGVGPHGRR